MTSSTFSCDIARQYPARLSVRAKAALQELSRERAMRRATNPKRPGKELMLFNMQLAMVVDAIDQAQAEIIALGVLQAAKAEVHDQAARVVDDAWKVTSRDE